MVWKIRAENDLKVNVAKAHILRTADGHTVHLNNRMEILSEI